MIDITTTVQEAVAKMKRVPRQLDKSARYVFDTAVMNIRRIMSRPGLSIVYPVNWDSDKQKYFVIGKLRAEGNLPYERTDQTVAAWTTKDLPDGTELSNVGHKAVFLFGTPSGHLPSARKVLPTGQSHIHENRWRPIHKVIQSVMSRIPKDILERFKIESNG